MTSLRHEHVVNVLVLSQSWRMSHCRKNRTAHRSDMITSICTKRQQTNLLRRLVATTYLEKPERQQRDQDRDRKEDEEENLRDDAPAEPRRVVSAEVQAFDFTIIVKTLHRENTLL